MRRRPGDGRGWWWAQRALPAAWAVLALAAVALRRTATSELASISPASARWAQGAVADEAFLDSQQKSSRGELTGEGDPADRREAVHRQHEFRRSFTHGDTESSLVRTIPGKSGARRPLIAPVRWPTYRRGPDDGGSFVKLHVVQGASSSSLSNDYEQKTGWKGEFFDMTKCKHSLSYLVCHMDDDKEVIDLLTTLSLSCARKHPPTRASLNKQGRWKKGQVKDIKKLPTFAEMEGKSPSKTEESQEVDFNDGSFRKLGFNDKFFARWTGVLRIKRAGAYTFRTCSDDGSNLFIGNDKVVDNDGLHGIQCREGTVNLASGDSMISVNFFENGGGASCKVEWKGPDVGESFVKTRVLSNSLASPPSSSSLLAALRATPPQASQKRLAAMTRGYGGVGGRRHIAVGPLIKTLVRRHKASVHWRDATSSDPETEFATGLGTSRPKVSLGAKDALAGAYIRRSNNKVGAVERELDRDSEQFRPKAYLSRIDERRGSRARWRNVPVDSRKADENGDAYSVATPKIVSVRFNEHSVFGGKPTRTSRTGDLRPRNRLDPERVAFWSNYSLFAHSPYTDPVDMCPPSSECALIKNLNKIHLAGARSYGGSNWQPSQEAAKQANWQPFARRDGDISLCEHCVTHVLAEAGPARWLVGGNIAAQARAPGGTCAALCSS